MVSNSFTFEDGVGGKDRRDLADFLRETAARALSGGGDPDDLAAAFLRVLGTRIDTNPGPVSIRIGQLDQDKRLVVRRLIYSARERAAAGEGSRMVAGALLALLGAWEQTIGYDPKPRYDGPRNLWGEPSTSSRTRGLGGIGEPIAR